MGVITAPKPGELLVPAGSAARSSVEAYDPKKHDRFFEQVDGELQDKGFLVAAADDLPVIDFTCVDGDELIARQRLHRIALVQDDGDAVTCE